MTSLEDRLLQDMLVLALAGPVVQKVDSTMRWINRYPLSTAINFPDTYPPDNDLSSEQGHPTLLHNKSKARALIGQLAMYYYLPVGARQETELAR